MVKAYHYRRPKNGKIEIVTIECGEYTDVRRPTFEAAKKAAIKNFQNNIEGLRRCIAELEKDIKDYTEEIADYERIIEQIKTLQP